MAIEQTRSTEARAPVGPQGASRGREGDNAGESFNSVLGSVNNPDNASTEPAEASAPAHEPEPSVKDKDRRDGKPGKTTAKAASEDDASAAAQAAAALTPDAPVAAAPDAGDASALAAALAGTLGGPASALAAAAVSALGNVAAQATGQGGAALTGRATSTELPGIDAVAASSSMAAMEGTRGAAGGVRSGASRAANVATAGTDTDAAAAAQPEGAAARPRFARGATGALQGAAQNAQGNASAQTQTALQQAGQAVAQEVRDTTGKPMVDEAMQRLVAQTQSADTAAAGAELTTELRTLRRGGAAGEGTGGTVTASGHTTTDAIYNRHALMADATAPVSGLPADANRTGMEDRMAAQVSYWLSQNTQNAQLSLDTLGGPPVEVNIQVKGNEAQVAFRSDHAGTRELLGSSLTQLRDLLTSEGLQLSGATVDSGALAQAQAHAQNQAQGQSGNGGDASQNGRGGIRQIGTVELPASVARSLPAGSSGRSLDLFV